MAETHLTVRVVDGKERSQRTLGNISRRSSRLRKRKTI